MKDDAARSLRPRRDGLASAICRRLAAYALTAALLGAAAGALAGAAPAPPAVPAADQKRTPSRREAPAPTPPHPIEITVDRFANLTWQPQTNYLNSPGPVRITIRDMVTGQSVLIDADDAAATPILGPDGTATGQVNLTVKGSVRVTRPEGTLVGHSLTYNAQDQTGHLLDARGTLTGQGTTLNIAARSLDLAPSTGRAGGETLTVENASFTTCVLAHPDYHISARSARISSDGTVIARDITLYLGRTRIFSWPSLRRNFRRAVDNPVPLPGYHKELGPLMHFGGDIISRPATSMDSDLQLALRRTPRGLLSYEHDLGTPPPDAAPPRTRLHTAADPLPSILATTPALLRAAGDPDITARRSTVYGMLTAGTYVRNRNRTDLSISRLPEVGISLRNIFNRPDPYAPGAQRPEAQSLFGAAVLSPARWFANLEISGGYYQERPTHVDTSRVGARMDATSPLLEVDGPLYARYGGTAWTNAYGTGSAYALLAPEAELDLLIGRSTLVGAGYRYLHDFGHTPFLWDRRDVTHEMRLRYGYLGGRWAWDLAVTYDMTRFRAYDTLVSVRRRFDCMEVGIGYSARSQGLGLILNLLPGQPVATHTAAPR